jgi:hypothetical protein
MLKISAAKVAHAIARAREHDAVAGSWESQMQQIFQEERREEIIDDFTTAYTRGALAEFIESLSGEEQASLLAIAWIGRGTFAPENLEEALEKAHAEQVYPGGDYLTGIPLLAEYLLDGMEKLGYALAERDDKPSRLQ